MTKRYILYFYMLITCLLFRVDAGFSEETIQIKGSDTMVNLAQAWAEAFMEKNPTSFIAVTGGGSGTGVASLINGTCDIAICSRTMKAEEIDLAHQKNIDPKEFIVGLDGIAVVVHPTSPIDKLTMDELADIFTGKITNWKELGGPDKDIVILSREVNSGTHVYFKEHVLRRNDPSRQDEFSPSALLMPSSQAIADEVAQNEQAIGYYGMGYISPAQKLVAISKGLDSPYVSPIIENVTAGTYAISRPLFVYTNGGPKGLVKNFLDFILSDEGQKIVIEIDFVPIKLHA